MKLKLDETLNVTVSLNQFDVQFLVEQGRSVQEVIDLVQSDGLTGFRNALEQVRFDVREEGTEIEELKIGRFDFLSETTGGGCMALLAAADEKFHVLLTDELELPVEGGYVEAGIYDENGDGEVFYEGALSTLTEALIEEALLKTRGGK